MIRAFLYSLLVCLFTAQVAQAGRLSNAESPYLRQHANDAINWYPWGEEAFEQARRENKLIYLSIGYATCHWCHVMTRTTFKDEKVVDLLNQNYISILVDREERPDVDNHFMKVLQAMNGISGWPGNLFLTADLVPLFGYTYLAPLPKQGAPGFLQVGRYLTRAWSNQRSSLLADVELIRGQILDLTQPIALGKASSKSDPRKALTTYWSKRFDPTYGGFDRESKFPRSPLLSLFLRQGVIENDQVLLDMVYKTLDHMAASGLRDQLGGSFHRYTRDPAWHIPHFEVTLEDNALLAQLYLEAYQVSRRPRYAAIARSTLEGLLTRFRLPSGGFASALDADSGGIEGGFYTWTEDELLTVLGADAKAVIDAYLSRDEETVAGRSVLHLLNGAESLMETEKQLATSRTRLLAARSRRQPLTRDDKMVTAWNAMAVSAFAIAARTLKEPRYLDIAREVMTLIVGQDATPEDLTRIRSDNQPPDVGTPIVFLDDYAFVVQAMIDLYETDFNVAHLESARAYMMALIARFQTKPDVPFQLTPTDRIANIPPLTILREEAAPSGNAAALTALQRLALYSADPLLEQQAQAILQALGRFLEDEGHTAPGLLESWDFAPTEAREIVIVGPPDDKGTKALLAELRARLLPGTVVALLDPAHVADVKRWLLLADRPMIDGKASAYVCRNRICKSPVNTTEDMLKQLIPRYKR